MKIKQENSLTLSASILHLLNQHKNVWKNHDAIKDNLHKLNLLIERICELGLQPIKKVKTSSLQKYQNRELLVNLTYITALRLKCYAKLNDDLELLSHVIYSKSKLAKSNKPDLISICKTVHRKALENRLNTVDYQITDDDLVTLFTAIHEFNIINETRDSINDRIAAAKSEMEILFTQGDKLLLKMDRLIESKIKDTGFSNLYFQARKIKRTIRRSKNKESARR